MKKEFSPECYGRYPEGDCNDCPPTVKIACQSRPHLPRRGYGEFNAGPGILPCALLIGSLCVLVYVLVALIMRAC